MGKPMDRSKRVFGCLTTFEQAFPQLEDAFIEYGEVGQNAGGWDFEEKIKNGEGYEGTYSLKNIGGLIHCHNRLCRDGGFELEGTISKMISETKIEGEYRISCRGREPVPKHAMPRYCENTLYVKIKLQYKK